MSDTSQDDQSIRSLLVSVKTDATNLFKAQAELTKAELNETKREAGTTGGAFFIALIFGALGFVFLLVSIAWLLVFFGLPEWAGFGIVTLALLLIAAVGGIVGIVNAKKIKGPRLSKIEWEKTRAALTGGSPEQALETTPTSATARSGSSENH